MLCMLLKRTQNNKRQKYLGENNITQKQIYIIMTKYGKVTSAKIKEDRKAFVVHLYAIKTRKTQLPVYRTYKQNLKEEGGGKHMRVIVGRNHT